MNMDTAASAYRVHSGRGPHVWGWRVRTLSAMADSTMRLLREMCPASAKTQPRQLLAGYQAGMAVMEGTSRNTVIFRSAI